MASRTASRANPLLARLHKLLGLQLVEWGLTPSRGAPVVDGALAAEPLQHDANLLLGGGWEDEPACGLPGEPASEPKVEEVFGW